MKTLTKLLALASLLFIFQSCSKEDQERLKLPLDELILGKWKVNTNSIIYQDKYGKSWTEQLEMDPNYNEIFVFKENTFSIKKSNTDKIESYKYTLPNQKLKSSYDYGISEDIAIDVLPDAEVVLLLDRMSIIVWYELENHNEYHSITYQISFERVK